MPSLALRFTPDGNFFAHEAVAAGVSGLTAGKRVKLQVTLGVAE